MQHDDHYEHDERERPGNDTHASVGMAACTWRRADHCREHRDRRTVVDSLAAVAIFAAVLIVTAIFQLIHAFKVGSWPRSAWYGLSGVLYAIAGFLVVAFPLGGALTLAVLLAILFIADGTLRVLFAMAAGCRPGLVHSSGMLRHSYRGHPAYRMADDGIMGHGAAARGQSHLYRRDEYRFRACLQNAHLPRGACDWLRLHSPGSDAQG